VRRDEVRPTRLGVEASSACNLRCPSCPTTSGAIHPAVGTGVLALHDFEALLDANPRVRHVELANHGEILLNPQLEAILAAAHSRGSPSTRRSA
jgi:MoaA/NifB/PqqE/SkfB family radical SAM enzyme